MRGLTILLVGWFWVAPYSALAYYTNANISHIYHQPPVWFVQETSGDWVGETEGGHAFRQVVIENDLQVRMHKFSIGTAFWYVTDKGVISANNDLLALSIYLTLA